MRSGQRIDDTEGNTLRTRSRMSIKIFGYLYVGQFSLREVGEQDLLVQPAVNLQACGPRQRRIALRVHIYLSFWLNF